MQVRSLDGEPFDFGPGMTRVSRGETRLEAQDRILWSWGEQEDMGAGQIGLGILYPAESFKGEVEGSDGSESILRYSSNGESTMEMAIVGGWTGDDRFHNAEQWLEYLRGLRQEIDNPVQVEVVK